MTVRRTQVRRQNPAYRPATAPYSCVVMRRDHRVVSFAKNAFTYVVLAYSAASCARPIAPRTIPPVVLTPAPPPIEIAPALTLIAAEVRDARYDVRSIARVTSDSAGRPIEQRIETSGVVTVALQRSTGGAFRGSGRVDSFAVQMMEAEALRIDSVFFDAILDATSLRVVTRPSLVNECDRAETSATALAREILLRVPRAVQVGARWVDSTIAFVCRSGVPIAVRTVNDYVVERIDSREKNAMVHVRRAFIVRMDGKLASPWRPLEVSGVGSGAQQIVIDAVRGAVQSLNGASTITLQLTDRSRASSARTQRVVQQVELKIERRP